MKLTALLLVVTCVHVSAHGYSQTVSFSGKNVPLNAVLQSIEKQTGLSFFFNYALIKDTKPVTVDIQNVSVDEALDKILRGQGLDFYKTGKTIFIVKGKGVPETSPASDDNAAAPPMKIRGKVVNARGEYLEGATVMLKNGKNGTLTNEKGEFELNNVPGGATLKISYLGYQQREVAVSGSGPITIELTASNNLLDEVQVGAYSSNSKRLETGNITMVKGEDIAKQPVNNPLLALEGRVPGLLITQANGLPGGGVVVRLQGVNSIGQGNDPLYVIDGVPYSSQTLTTVGRMSNPLGSSQGAPGSGTGNPMAFINPSDIESISVLKDADATAIYGSRAANGAILITTKKGKSGDTKVDINLQQGFGKVVKKLDLLNTQQYLEMRHEAKKNDGLTTSATDYDINGVWDTTRYTDWQQKFLGGTASYSNMTGTVSGGTTNVQYLIGGTYHRETTVFPGSFSDQKASLHFNLNTSSANQKFKVQLSGTYLSDDNHLPITDLTTAAITTAPDAPALYKADGSLNWMPNAAGSSTWTNPGAALSQTYGNKTNNLISSAMLSYRLLPGLEIKSNFGYTNMQTNELGLIPLVSLKPEIQALGPANRASNFSSNTVHTWIAEPEANYKKSIADGKLDVLIGASIQRNIGSGDFITATGFNSDAVEADLLSASTLRVVATTSYVYKYAALFGRVNYAWKEKYILNFTARRDGSSRFGSENQFHNFGSVGIAWVFNEEEFIKNSLRFLSFGKIRGSIGTTGNDQINNYGFLNLYNPISVGVPYQGVTGIAPNGLPNPYLQWEETRKIQGGIDAGFLNDKALLTVNYAFNRSSNQLQSLPLPVTTGFGSISANLPAIVQNTSLEGSLSFKIIRAKNFEWTSSVNFTIPRNKLVSYPTLVGTSYLVGQPLSIRQVYHFLGVNPTTGLYQVEDSHGSPTSSPNPITDRIKLINASFPKYYGGFENAFKYKGLHLDIFIQFVKQIGADYFFGTYPGSFNINNPVTVLGRWQKIGDISSIQKFNSNFSLASYTGLVNGTDAVYKDASFIRLTNFSLTYQIPGKWQSKAGVKNFQMYLQGQNLLTITSFDLDPESKSTSSIAPLRVLTVGLQLGF